MKKLLMTMMILSIFDYASFKYLKDIYTSRKAYHYISSDKSFLLLNKDIEIYDISDFDFNYYFDIRSFNDPNYSYEFKDNLLNIDFNDKTLIIDYKILEKEIIEIYIKEENNKVIDIPQQDIDKIIEIEPIIEQTQDNHNNQNIFNLHNSSLTYSIDTDMSLIISGIMSSFTSDVEVNIDYSFLNPASKGVYPIYFYYGNNSAILYINII